MVKEVIGVRPDETALMSLEIAPPGEREPKGRIKYVIFDWNGTLVNTMPEFYKTLADYADNLERIGVSNNGDIEKTRSYFAGLFMLDFSVSSQTKLVNFNKVFAKELGLKELSLEKAEADANTLDNYLSNVDGQLFDEVKEVLFILKDMGYGIGISSNDYQNYLDRKVQSSGIGNLVDKVFGRSINIPGFIKGEPHFSGFSTHYKKDYEAFKSQALFVGDMSFDMKVASDAGITALGREGLLSEKQFRDSHPNLTVIKDLSVLPRLLPTL